MYIKITAIDLYINMLRHSQCILWSRIRCLRHVLALVCSTKQHHNSQTTTKHCITKKWL